MFERAGAAPVGPPGSEIITSLQQGVIQAADYSSYTEDKSVGLQVVGLALVLFFPQIAMWLPEMLR